MNELVAQAVKALKVDVPVMWSEVEGNKIALWLYGRDEPVTWTRPARKKTTRKRTAKTAGK